LHQQSQINQANDLLELGSEKGLFVVDKRKGAGVFQSLLAV
jgi:hypothetical protein